ncbi:MAG: ClpXP protease specificity-enhancing factor [Burkholderiales bacterium]
MPEKSTKPYLIRAIHEWCSDCNYTPYLSVKVDANTRVPTEYVKNGEIVLNLSYDATHRLTIGNDAIQFSARFNGVSRECSVPVEAVLGIFARENGQGLFVPIEENETAAPAAETPSDAPTSPPTRPKLQIVK